MCKSSVDFGILILGFNRPDVLLKALTALDEHGDLSQRIGFFSADGPRRNSETELIHETHKVFAHFEKRFKAVHRFYEDSNVGLRNKVIQGVTQAFEEVDYLLVLEDDCLIGPSTFEFFQYGFDWLKRRNLGVISGNYLGNQKGQGAFLANRFSSWGWGTNKETWNLFLLNSFSRSPLVELKSHVKRLTKEDPFPNRFEYARIAANLERLDSWAIPFDMFLRSEDIRTLKPTENQIQNIGFGLAATHTSRGSSLSLPAEPLAMSSLVLVDEKTSARLEKHEAWAKFNRLALEKLCSLS